MWAYYDCFLTAARDILGLQLGPHAKYAAWEQCAVEGGFRWMHEEFCMVSDFPEVLKVDEQNRPHCDDGPSHRWRDGWEFYFIHGVKVTRQIVMEPQTLTIDQIRMEKNAEVRRIMLERFGWDRFAEEGEFEVIHRDEVEFQFPAIPVSEMVSAETRLVTTYRAGKEVAELIKSKTVMRGDGLPLTFVRLTDPSTGRRYHLRADPNCTRAYEAVGKSGGMTEKQYKTSMYHRQGDVFLIPLGKSSGRSLHS